MWNPKRSLLLSKFFTLVFMAILAFVAVGAPWVVQWLIIRSVSLTRSHYVFFLATIYSGAAFVAVLLYNLYRLLHNMGKDQVFVESNVKYLRWISWCCFIGAGICLLSSLYYSAWLIAAAAAAFVGLVVRVIKNVVDQAIQIKQENDFTI